MVKDGDLNNGEGKFITSNIIASKIHPKTHYQYNFWQFRRP